MLTVQDGMLLAGAPRGAPWGARRSPGSTAQKTPCQPGWGPAVLSAPATWIAGREPTPCGPSLALPALSGTGRAAPSSLPIKAGLEDLSQLLSEPLIGVWTGTGAARGSRPCCPAGSPSGLHLSSQRPSPCRPLGQPQGSSHTQPPSPLLTLSLFASRSQGSL